LLGVQRSTRQKVIAGAAVAVAVGGGAFAPVPATGEGGANKRGYSQHAVHRLYSPDLRSAAAYLGVPVERLESELSSSKTLAQIADAQKGKSAQGLIDAIVQARRARLTKAAATLPRRVGAVVNAPVRLARAHKGGTRGLAGHGVRALGLLGTGRLATTVADYLAITPAQLRTELRSGKTLAQLADATPGKSSSGLVDAIVAVRKQRIAKARAAGRITPERAAFRESRLAGHVQALVGRRFVPAGKP
jgi:hypothetical protein